MAFHLGIILSKWVKIWLKMGWWSGEKIYPYITWVFILRLGDSGDIPSFVADHTIFIAVRCLLLQKFRTLLFMVIESQNLWQICQELQGKATYWHKDEVVNAYRSVADHRHFLIPFSAYHLYTDFAVYNCFGGVVAYSELREGEWMM